MLKSVLRGFVRRSLGVHAQLVGATSSWTGRKERGFMLVGIPGLGIPGFARKVGLDIPFPSIICFVGLAIGFCLKRRHWGVVVGLG